MRGTPRQDWARGGVDGTEARFAMAHDRWDDQAGGEDAEAFAADGGAGFQGLSESALASRGINPFSGPRPVHPNVTFVRESLRAFPDRAPDILTAAVRSSPEIGPALVDAALAACPQQRQSILEAARRLGALRLRTLASVFFALILDRILGGERQAKAQEASAPEHDTRAPSGAALAPLGVMALLIGLDSAGILSAQSLVATASAADGGDGMTDAMKDIALAGDKAVDVSAVSPDDELFAIEEAARPDDADAAAHTHDDMAAFLAASADVQAPAVDAAVASAGEADRHAMAAQAEDLAMALGGSGADRLVEAVPAVAMATPREDAPGGPRDPFAEELEAVLSNWTAAKGIGLDAAKALEIVPELLRASQMADGPLSFWREPHVPDWADRVADQIAARATWFETSGLRQVAQFLSNAKAYPNLAKGLDVGGLVDRIDDWITIGTKGRYELKTGAIVGADDAAIADAVVDIAARAAEWMMGQPARGVVPLLATRLVSGLESQLPRGFKAGDAADALDALAAHRAWRAEAESRIDAIARAVGDETDDDILAAFLATPLSALDLNAEESAAATAAGLDADAPFAAYLAVLAAEQEAAAAAADQPNPFAV